MITSKATQLLSVGKKTSLLVLPVTAILFAAQPSGLAQKAEIAKAPDQIALTDDAFGKVSEADIKSLFEAEEHDEKLVKDQLSRADYDSKQKHRFELHQSRKGRGIVYFRTNEGNYGKLLYTWGIGPKLHLKEIVVFDSQSGKTVVRTDKNIVLDLAGHYDLDTGVGTHTKGRDGYGDDNYRPDLHHGSMHGPDRHLKGIDGASFLFPIGHGALDAG